MFVSPRITRPLRYADDVELAAADATIFVGTAVAALADDFFFIKDGSISSRHSMTSRHRRSCRRRRRSIDDIYEDPAVYFRRAG